MEREELEGDKTKESGTGGAIERGEREAYRKSEGAEEEGGSE